MASQKNQSPQCHISLYPESNAVAPISRVFPKEYTDSREKIEELRVRRKKGDVP
jgi:hypothetical protein